MMERLRRVVRHCLRAVDGIYHRWHRLQPVGPLLFVGCGRYDGPARRFADGTELRPGDLLGTLHFNNARIAALDAGTPAAIGLSFARLLFKSLRTLADLTRCDERFREVKVFRGIGWLRHGAHLGFINEPVPESRHLRFLAMHIGLLVWAFAPPKGTAIAASPEPTITWLTREALVKRFGNERNNAQTVRDSAADARRRG
jgi:hypothetical protein